MRDEESSVCELIESIKSQTREPDEVILVDGGSTDRTVEVAREHIGTDHRFRILQIGPASPGRGRNEGIAAASYDLIALTDAGIRLEREWLENLEKVFAAQEAEGSADIVFGNFHPIRDSFFEKLAALTYVPPSGSDGHRGRSIASCLLEKRVWETVGGFPDSRAAEDLFFIEKAERMGFRHQFAPGAAVHWQLRPDLLSTYRKFFLYSKHNVLAGRQWDWHYGIARQYALLLPFLVLAIIHSFWWLLAFPVWLLLRSTKRILSHRREAGWSAAFDPLNLGGVSLLIIVIDIATFAGWIRAKTDAS